MRKKYLLFLVTILIALAIGFLIFYHSPKPIISTTPVACSPSNANQAVSAAPALKGERAIFSYRLHAQNCLGETKEIVLNYANANQDFFVNVGTVFLVNFGRPGNFDLSSTSDQNIFQNNGEDEVFHLPINSLGSYTVERFGEATITVIETP